jgi:hypothetical protein
MLRGILTGTKVRVARGRFRKSRNEKFIVHLLLRGICNRYGRDKALLHTKLWSENLKEIDRLGEPRVNMGCKEHSVRR